MKTTFSKYLKTHVPAKGAMLNGSISIWQRMSCDFGNVGGKF